MSKARLVITAVVVEGRSQREVAWAYGVSQGWVSRLVARYQAEGEAAFEPRSRRPKTSPQAIPDRAAELIIALRKELAGQGLDAGPETICWRLAHHHQIRVSQATVSRYLARAGPDHSRARQAAKVVVGAARGPRAEAQQGGPGRGGPGSPMSWTDPRAGRLAKAIHVRQIREANAR
jgi:transposase